MNLEQDLSMFMWFLWSIFLFIMAAWWSLHATGQLENVLNLVKNS